MFNGVRRSLLLAFPLALFVAGSAAASPIVFDDFSTPADPAVFVVGINTANPTVGDFTGPGILGTRQVKVDAGPGPVPVASYAGYVGDGSFYVNTSNPGAGVILEYDFTGLTPPGIDIGGSGNTAFKIDFNFLNSGFSGDVPLTIFADGGNGESATFTGNITESGSPFAFFAPFDQFVNTPGMGDTVVKLVFLFNNTNIPNVDFEITRVAAVPEPSTLALAGLGLAFGCVAVRRRQR